MAIENPGLGGGLDPEEQQPPVQPEHDPTQADQAVHDIAELEGVEPPLVQPENNQAQDVQAAPSEIQPEADFDDEAHVETQEINPLQVAREQYGQALRSRSKVFFGRVSDQQLEEKRASYREAIQGEVQKKIDEVKAEFNGVPTDPVLEAQLNARIADIVLTNQAEEENALLMTMKESSEVTAVQKFQQFWKKNAKTRLLIGGALLGGVIVATATGQFGAAAGIQALRTPVSGVGSAMTIESMADIARNKFFDTKELTEAEIRKMQPAELDRRLAAHETAFADVKDGQFGVKQRGVFKKHEDATGKMLLDELKLRRELEAQRTVQEMGQAGATPDVIADTLIKRSLFESGTHHLTLENQREKDRRFTVAKWTAAIAGGTISAALSGLSALGKAAQASDMGKSVAGQAGKAAVKAGGMMSAHSDMPDSSHSAPVETPVDKNWSGLEKPVRIDADKYFANAHAFETPQDAAPDSSAAPADTLATGKVEPEAFAAQMDSAPIQESAMPDATNVAAAETVNAPADTTVVGTETVASATPAAETAAATAVAETVEAKKTAIETVKKGDSVWKIVERQLHERVGKDFDNLDEARKTYMIDALKDKIADTPSEYGLTNVDDLSAGQQLDLSHLFEGKDAVPLTELQHDAVALDQSAVDSITEHNEMLREWVQTHPHEALTSTKVEQIITGLQASAAEPIVSEKMHQVWVDGVMADTRANILCELAEKYPAEYVQAHAENPELYPAVAGVTEAPELSPEDAAAVADTRLAPMIFEHNAFEAKQHFADVSRTVFESMSKEDAEAMTKELSKKTVGEIMKKGFLEKELDEMEGGTLQRAKKLAVAARKLLRAIPKGEYLKSDKFGAVLMRVQEAKK